MSCRPWGPMAAILLCCLPGCDPETPAGNNCLTEPGIAPGIGVATPEGLFCLGASEAAIRHTNGAPDRADDLGGVGLRFAYVAQRLTGLYANASNVRWVKSLYLHDGCVARTPGGVGIGSDEAEVRAELGEPEVDPFVGVWWYRSQGIAFELASGKVIRIQLFGPAHSM